MLKLNPGFEVRNVCGENIIVALGESNVDFSHVISLNETSLIIWRELEKGAESVDEIAEAIMEDYDVDAETCHKDVQSVLDQLADYKVIEKTK